LDTPSYVFLLSWLPHSSCAPGYPTSTGSSSTCSVKIS